MYNLKMNLKRIWNKVTMPISTDSSFIMGNELSHAIKEQKTDLVNYLVNKNIDIDKERHNGSPIFRAISTANLNLVKTLIKKGVELNFQQERLKFNPNYFSPLHIACLVYLMSSEKEDTRFKIIKSLIDGGADVNGSAGQHSILNAVMMFLENKELESVSPLHTKQSKEGRYDSSKEYRLIELFADKGANLNQICNRTKLTPLTLVSKLENFSIFKLLVSKGADISKKDGFDKIPLDYSLENSDSIISKFFCSNKESQSSDFLTKENIPYF